MSPVCFLVLKVLEGEEEGALLCSHPVFVFGGNQAGMDGGATASSGFLSPRPQVIQPQLWVVFGGGSCFSEEVQTRLWDPCRCYRRAGANSTLTTGVSAGELAGGSVVCGGIPAMLSVFGKHLGYKCVCLHIHADVDVTFQTLT